MCHWSVCDTETQAISSHLVKYTSGGKVISALSGPHSIDATVLHNFRLRCLEFYIEATAQILTRFPLDNIQMKRLEAIDPQVVIEKRVPSIAPLAASFPTLLAEEALNKIDSEWRLLRNTDMNLSADVNAEHFWKRVRDTKQGDGSPMFPVLSEFVGKLLCLPHSSATVERVFSQINLMKTKTRNSLVTQTLDATLHAKRVLGGASCYDFIVNERCVSCMKKDMYTHL